MIPATVPPFPFYIINKDIIKGSFPFRKTFHTPKPDFTTPISQPRFQPPRVFRRPEDPEQNHGNGINRRRRTLCQLKPISQPRFRPPRVFRRHEEPEQNHGNGTNRRRRKVFQSGEHANSKIILSLPPKTSKPDSRHHRPVRQKVRF